MSVYTLRTYEHGWRVTKFDSDFNVESSYVMLDGPKGVACECPQSARGHCRHIDILGMFQAADLIDKGWFLNFEHGQWLPPLETGGSPPSPAPDELRKTEGPKPTSAPPSSSGFSFEDVKEIRRR